MSAKYEANQPKRSKSMCSLESDAALSNDCVFDKGKTLNSLTCRGYRSRTISNSSIEVYVVNDSDTEEVAKPADSGLDSSLGDKTFDELMLQNLEQKIDRLSDMFLEQCRLLTNLKEEIKNSKTVIEKTDYAQIGTLKQFKKFISQPETDIELASDKTSSGKTLLDAIECRASDYDQLIREVISGFLQSDEVKDHMVQATAESVKTVIGSVVSRDMSSMYLPILEHSHKRLLRALTNTVEDAFVELEENSVSLSKSVYKISNSLRRVIERHHCLLDVIADPQKNSFSSLKYTIEELLQKELSEWREKVLKMFASQLQIESEGLPEGLPEPPNPPIEYALPSAPQLESGRSIVDQLMTAAEIKKQIESEDINAAFERALCAGDLDLVMCACRTAVRVVFTPYCRLRQNVLLALLQQLSTDMVNETQLKCRYIEDAILNLDLKDPNTRAHLPLVVGEVRTHLMNFLTSYPSHASSRRVTLIKLAADNLLN